MATGVPRSASGVPPAGVPPSGSRAAGSSMGYPMAGEVWPCREGGSVAAEASARCPPGGRSELLARLPTACQYHLQGWMTPRAAATPTRGEAPGSEERQRGQGPGMAGEWLGECGPCPPCGPSGGGEAGRRELAEPWGGLAVYGSLWTALPRGLCAWLEGQGPEWRPWMSDVAEGLERAGMVATRLVVGWGESSRHMGLGVQGLI